MSTITAIATTAANAIRDGKGSDFGNLDIIHTALETIEASGVRTRKADREALEIDLSLYSNRLCDAAHLPTRYDRDHELGLAEDYRTSALDIARQMDARVS